MLNQAPSNVTIIFDGLFLYRLDRAGRFCDLNVHTAAPGHVMKIRVRSNNRVIFRKILCQDMLKNLRRLNLFVGEGVGFPPTAPSVTDNGDYSKILNLAGQDFYGRPRPIKNGMYGCSIRLNNGTILVENPDTCQRVKKGLFPMLHFKWASEDDWDSFLHAVQLLDSEAIKDLRPEVRSFAREVKINLSLDQGQALCLVSETNTNIFDPLVSGADYEIRIKYADVDPPLNLDDCQGFAHHSEALELDANEPVFGIFKPSFDENGSGSGTITFSDAGCCEGARMDQP